MTKVTEQSSNYANLDQMTTAELLQNMNKEDKSVPVAVEKCIPEIEKLVDGIVERMKKGGRLFYLGAGTSGRLGILDASEIPPTYGAPFDLIIGLIAGGDTAIRKAVENAEDDWDGGWRDMQPYNVNENDVVVGIAASGSTPYVIGAVKEARKRGILTGCTLTNDVKGSGGAVCRAVSEVEDQCGSRSNDHANDQHQPPATLEHRQKVCHLQF